MSFIFYWNNWNWNGTHFLPIRKVSNSGTTSIWQATPANLQTSEKQKNEIWQTALAKLEEWETPPERLFYRLIFSACRILQA